MARLRLNTWCDSETWLYRGGSTPEVRELLCHIPAVTIYLVPAGAPNTGWVPPAKLDEARRHDAIVDTGAPLTMLPYDVWRPVEHETQLMERATSEPRGVAGRVVNDTVRRVRLALLGFEDGLTTWIPPEWVVARCLDEPTPSSPSETEHENIRPLLGLTTPFLTQGRRFRHDLNTGQALDSEFHSSSPNAHEHVLPQWWLEDPPGWLARLFGAK